jgi:hypothetical protein
MNQIVDLFESGKANISEHITHIIVSGELKMESNDHEIDDRNSTLKILNSISVQ